MKFENKTVQWIAMKDISASSIQIRLWFKTELKQLADLIKMYGLIEPIIVRPVREKKYELLFGEWRRLAHIENGASKIQAIIADDVKDEDEDVLVLKAVEMLQRHRPNLIDNAEAVNQVVRLTQKNPEYFNNTEPMQAAEASEFIYAIPLKSIDQNPAKVRTKFYEPDSTQLMNSIKHYGLLRPLIVRPNPYFDNRYELIFGECRRQACLKLGYETIPAIIRNVTNNKMRLISFIENMHAQDLNVREKVQLMTDLIKQLRTPDAIAERLDVSYSMVQFYLNVSKFPSDERNLIFDTNFDFESASLLKKAYDDPKFMKKLGKLIEYLRINKMLGFDEEDL